MNKNAFDTSLNEEKEKSLVYRMLIVMFSINQRVRIHKQAFRQFIFLSLFSTRKRIMFVYAKRFSKLLVQTFNMFIK